MDRSRSRTRNSAIYTSIDRGSRMFYRHQLAFADDSLVEKMSVRRRVRSLLLTGIRGMVVASIEVLLSLVWVALYIADTYYSSTPAWITGINWAFVAAFAAVWLIHFTASPNRLRFLVSVYAVIDYVTIIPLFFASLGGTTFLRAISILRVFRLLRVLSLAPNERVKKLLQVSCILLCFIFVSSSLVLIVEPDTFNDFFTSFYFVIVAIVTVGFGDIAAQTPQGQALVICIILCGVVLLPMQAFALSRILSVKSDPVNGEYNSGHDSKHIIIFGNSLSPARLSDMITEFSIKYRYQRHMDLHIVVMQSSMPSSELRELAAPPQDGQAFIHVLRGSPLNYDDLKRCSAQNAECAVTVFDNDHDTCLVHMALKSFNRSLAIFALLQRPEKAPLFRAVAPFKENHGEVLPTVMSRLEISGALLARCIPTRGFATLICNLVRTRMVSMSAYEEEHVDYKRGAAYEIYFGVLPPSFSGSNFLDIALSVYSQHSALLIGLMTDGKHPLLNPGSTYTIKGGELAIFLAPDPSVTILIKDMQNLPLSMLPPHRLRLERERKRKRALKEARKTANESDKRRKRELDSLKKQDKQRHQKDKHGHPLSEDAPRSNEIELPERKRTASKSKRASSSTGTPSSAKKSSKSSPPSPSTSARHHQSVKSSGSKTQKDRSKQSVGDTSSSTAASRPLIGNEDPLTSTLGSSYGALSKRDSAGVELSSTISLTSSRGASSASPVRRRRKNDDVGGGVGSSAHVEGEVIGSGSGGSDQTVDEEAPKPIPGVPVRPASPSIMVTSPDGTITEERTEPKARGVSEPLQRNWDLQQRDLSDGENGDVEDFSGEEDEEASDMEEESEEEEEEDVSEEEEEDDDLHAYSKRQAAQVRSQLTWDSDVVERNKLIRYHEVAKGVEQLSRHYRVLESPRTFRSALVNKAPESGHIIMTGSVMDWVYYIAPLRNRSVSKCQPVIIVTAKPLTAKQWSSIAHFPEVYMMPGASLLKRRDIERLHVQGATHILITYGSSSSPASGGRHGGSSGYDGSMGGGSGAGGGGPKGSFGGMGVGGAGGLASQVAASEANADELNEEDEEYASAFDDSGQDTTPHSTRDTILIYSWLSRVCPQVRVIMDVRDEMDLRFLHKAEHALDSHIQQEIRSGTACATGATVERLLAQTVYNPLVLDVVLQLIFGTRHASLPREKGGSKREGKDRDVRERDPLGASSSKRSRDTVELPSGRGGSKNGRVAHGKRFLNGDRGKDNDDDTSSSDEEDQGEFDIKPIIRLEQIPSALKGGSYRELFEDFVTERDALPLGLYRQLPRPSKHRKQQFVYTCPPIDTPLQPGDRVYVLFPQVPKQS